MQNIDRRKRLGTLGYGTKKPSEFISFTGLHKPTASLPLTPYVESSRQLHKNCWNKGYATEGAIAAPDYTFKTLNLDEVVSLTTVSNTPSRAIMQHLRLPNSGQNFVHPDITENSYLSEHVLYNITQSKWHINA